MYGRFGTLTHFHVSEALAQRHRLADVSRSDNTGSDSKPCPKSFRASSIILVLTVTTLGALLAASVVIRIVAAA